MNIIGISVLEELKKYPVFKDAIIAGGMCRDHILGNKFKDVDVFVPCVNEGIFSDGLSKIEGIKFENNDFSFGNFKFNARFDRNKYTPGVNYKGKFDGLYRDTIPVQIMAYTYKGHIKSGEMESFGSEVVSGFNFWIDQIYWDGKELVVTPEANKDIKNGTATLCRLNSWDEMPGAMNKFLRLKEKYPHLRLESVYQIVDPRGKKLEKKSENKYWGAISTSSTTSGLQWFNAPDVDGDAQEDARILRELNEEDRIL